MVRSPVEEPVDDVWGGVKCRIDLDASRFTSDCLSGLAEFSHVEIVFLFHKVLESEIATA
jgi:tRNA (Thr-GGU) A37 N-methylase